MRYYHYLRSQLHAWYRGQLKACLDGEVSPLVYALLRHHIARCRECRDELGALRRIGSLLQVGVQEPTPWPGLASQILSVIPEQPVRPSQSTDKKKGLSWQRGGFAIAGVVGAIGLWALAQSYLPYLRAPGRQQMPSSSRISADSNRTSSQSQTATSNRPLVKDPFLAESGARNRQKLPIASPKTEEPSTQLAQKRREGEILPPTPHATPFGSGTPSDPLRLSVAVDNIGASCAHLMDVVQRYGGALTMASKPIDSAYNLPVDSDPEACYLLVRLPASHAKAFYLELRRMATGLPGRPMQTSKPSTSPPETALKESASALNGFRPPIAFVKPSPFLFDSPVPTQKSHEAKRPSAQPSPDLPPHRQQPSGISLANPVGPGGTVVYVIRLHVQNPTSNLTERGAFLDR
ncbi:hypothetical protein CTKA_00686 [Chthonomonas calidirosea]|uniref:Zinc-finger n=1 Tax=Chthonomonas calidirosea (strain DSM 23976 / ICMP 18418 / T49) TaxID=1303518 RepID=S0ESQ9_CHTCT|nr:hypothetical protein [Chthonomonas calidirosea]CCW34304.1 hypothetical protein CCALI_00470 [Chthonomonas calidirosea T49]CEK15160.1 hypothetical protein CTKA_00686 [Chthonomonas calidirosea]